MDLIALFELGDAEFRARFRATPLWRPRRRGLLRNAAIVLGNRPTEKAVPALVRGLNDDESLIRGACAWALGRHASTVAHEALELRFSVENDASVRQEIEHALQTQLTTTQNSSDN
jgi:epoxyqueuosine reductase